MGANPRLLFKVEVTVEPIDKASTNYDDHAREPIRQARRKVDSIKIYAQVQWSSKDRVEPARGGSREHDRTYLVFLVKDLQKKGWTPAKGDRVTIPNPPLPDSKVYLDGGFEPCMHKNGQARGLLCFWTDRQPTRVED